MLRATERDLRELRTVLAAAFNDDPVFGWLMPRDATRIARLRRFFELELRDVALAHGSVWTSSERSGAALSLPPGRWRTPPRVALSQGRVFGVRGLRAARLFGAMERRHPRAPHYYFACIGVAPETQGRGLGTRLIRATLDRCDEEALPAYLEASSERSAALYERLGFELVDELRVGGGPPLWLMLRQPRA